VGLVIALVLVPVTGPMARAWRCLELNSSGERADAEVVRKLESPTLVLMIQSGAQAGQACTARTSDAHHAALDAGDRLPIVYRPEAPGDCVLVATVENSALLFWSVAGAVALLVAMIFAGGVAIHRGFAGPVFMTSDMEVDPRQLSCPKCSVQMGEGYLVLLAGLHWRSPDEPVGMPHALKGLPGTVGWRTRPRLHAFRCEACSIVTFQYGKTEGRSRG